MMFDRREQDEQAHSGRRAVMCVIFLLGFLVVLLRLFDLHILQAETMTKKAQRQHHKIITLDSNRGMIVDRHGRALALNVDVSSVYASPVSVKDSRMVAKRLSNVLEIPCSIFDPVLRGTG